MTSDPETVWTKTQLW